MTTTSRVTISAHALKAAADFVSKDKAKRIANVRIVAADGTAHIVATDSYRLYHYEEEVIGNADVDILIPADDVKACKVTKSTEVARIDAEARTIETSGPRVGTKLVRMGEPEGTDGFPFPSLERIEALFPGDDKLGTGMVPSLNPGYAASAYKAFGALGMLPQMVHSGEMAPVTISAGWVDTGRKVCTGKPVPGAGTEYRETRCRLRILVMPVRQEKWFCEATRVVSAIEPEPEACDDGLKEAYALASADPDHVVVLRAFKPAEEGNDEPECEAPEQTPEPEPESAPEPRREYSQTCVRRDECPERLAYVLWAMDAAGNISYAVKRYRSASNAVTCGNAYAAEYLMDSPTCWGVFKGTDIAA